MSCTPFQLASFTPITDISQVEPYLIVNALQLTQESSCSLYNSEQQCTGVCNSNGCNDTSSCPSSIINCSYLLLISNIYQYTISQLQCVFSQTSISNNTFTISEQIIEFTLSNPNSNIENTTISSNQTTNVNITCMDLQSVQNQEQIATLMSECIQQVITFANQNPSVFMLPPSALTTSSSATTDNDSSQPSVNNDDIVNQSTSQVINSMISIQNIGTNEQENVVSITLTNMEYNNATISISQSDAIEYLAQNVAVSVINMVLPQLYPNLLSAFASLSSNNNETTPTTTSSSQKRRFIVIGCSVVAGVVVIILLLFVCIRLFR